MSRKGLTIENIVEAATELINENGFDQFSLRELAARLNVKPASLYNHTSNVAEITLAVGRIALETLGSRLKQASVRLEGKTRLLAIADEYRKYAKENEELYKAILHLPAYEDESIKEESNNIMQHLYEALSDFELCQKEKIQFSRAYRSAMHGFVSLEMSGYFRQNVDVDESYHYLMNSLLSGLDGESR